MKVRTKISLSFLAISLCIALYVVIQYQNYYKTIDGYWELDHEITKKGPHIFNFEIKENTLQGYSVMNDSFINYKNFISNKKHELKLNERGNRTFESYTWDLEIFYQTGDKHLKLEWFRMVNGQKEILQTINYTKKWSHSRYKEIR